MGAAAELLASVNKALGENALRLGTDDKFKVSYIETGLLPIDLLMHGGIPRGRFSVITGDYSTLKTYIGYQAIASVQRSGGRAALIDTEHAFEEQWAKECGIELGDLLVLHPETGELAVDAAEVLIRENIDLIVFDSVAATLPQAEQTKRLHKENIQPGRQAALMSAACRRLTAANDKTAVLWINQLRENIGITFGPTEKGTGGRALPYYASYIINIKKTGKITRDIKVYTGDKWQSSKEQIGQKFRAEVQKSKLSRPFREVWFDWLMTSSQIDLDGYLIAQGIEHGIVEQSGKTWRHGQWKAVGRDKFKALVSDTPALRSSLRKAVKAAHGVSQGGPKRLPRKKGLRKR